MMLFFKKSCSPLIKWREEDDRLEGCTQAFDAFNRECIRFTIKKYDNMLLGIVERHGITRYEREYCYELKIDDSKETLGLTKTRFKNIDDAKKVAKDYVVGCLEAHFAKLFYRLAKLDNRGLDIMEWLRMFRKHQSICDKHDNECEKKKSKEWNDFMEKQ